MKNLILLLFQFQLLFQLIQTNLLYEKFPVENGFYGLKTILLNISKPTGIEIGLYKENEGLFISSITLSCIYFINKITLNYNIIAGIPYNSGYNDGQLLYSLFSSPSRMIYDYNKNVLYITEKLTGMIRILNFNSDQVQTLYYINNNNNYEILKFQHSIQTSGDFPGLDIKLSNNILYIVDTIKLYQINSITFINGHNIGTVIEYTNLLTYMDTNGYPVSENLRSCLYSVAPDEKRKVLYVSVSYAKNVILQVFFHLELFYFL